LMETVKEYRSFLDKKLHEPGCLNDFFNKIEAKISIPRIHLVTAFVVISGFYLVFGYFAELACNIVGFLYPCYRSFKAVESPDKKDDTQWLTYWVVFAAFNLVEFASDIIVGWFPFYWLVKCAALLYLYLPMTMGAEKMYHNYLKPLFLKYETNIDHAASMTKEFLAEEAKKRSQ